MRLKAIAVLLAALSLTFSGVTFANGAWSSVTVSNVEPCVSAYGCSTNGYVQFVFSNNSTNTPACVGSNLHSWGVIDITTAIGAYIASQLLSAKLTGATVTVYGLGTCTNNIENVGEVIQ